MTRHLITLIWNRKRSLVWIFIEQMLVFGVLLFCFTNIVHRVQAYYSKGKLHTDNVVCIGYNKLEYANHEDVDDEASTKQFLNLLESMKQWPSVEYVSTGRTGALPVLNNYTEDSVRFHGRQNIALIKYCDENYYHILEPKLSEGQWFRDIDASAEMPPALITQRLADKAGITGSAIGKTVEYGNRTYCIVGIVEAYKERDVEWEQPALFMPVSLSDGFDEEWEYIVRFKPGVEKDFTKAYLAAFYKEFSRDHFIPYLLDLSKFRNMVNFFSLGRFFMYVIPTAFLVIFAFLGTFGLVWMQSKKRMGELGLRMALGSTPVRLQCTIIMENLLLTTFAMLPGFIIVANLYAFAPKGWEWITAVIAAIVLMWLFAVFSAWYPARLAAKVQPVEALRANQ